MARPDISPSAPIPVIKSTNYTQQFADRDAIKARLDAAKTETSPVGPFSALFDWKDEEQRAKDYNDKQQEVQRKIMRGNAFGDAMRLMIEGVGGMAGATITPRNVNPFILKSVSDYAKNDMDYMERMQGIRAKKLAAGQMDLQHKLGQEAAAAERVHQEAMQREKELNDFISASKLQEQLHKFKGDEAAAEGEREKQKQATQALLEIEVARKKAQFDRGMGLMGDGSTTGLDVRTAPQKGDKDTMQFVTPDSKQTIYINPGLMNYIRTQLQTNKGKYDQSVPQVLRDAMSNKAIKPEALATVFTDQWDYIRDNILPPDVYKQIYGAEPGQAAPKTAPTGPVAVKTDQGVDLDNDSKLQLVGDVHALLDKTAKGQEVKQAKKLIEERYKAIGKLLPSKDINDMADDLVREWRAEKRKASSSSKAN
jgi:hypothetical protein